jgi:hypothetical protein
LEDTILESFAQLGYDVGLDELLEQAKAISEMQPECGETTELSFPTPYSSAVEPSDLISERK